MFSLTIKPTASLSQIPVAGRDWASLVPHSTPMLRSPSPHQQAFTSNNESQSTLIHHHPSSEIERYNDVLELYCPVFLHAVKQSVYTATNYFCQFLRISKQQNVVNHTAANEQNTQHWQYFTKTYLVNAFPNLLELFFFSSSCFRMFPCSLVLSCSVPKL